MQRAVDGGRNVVSGLSVTIPVSGNWIGSQDFHTPSRVFVTPVNDESKKKLRKGDLVQYSGHISIVYSDEPDAKNEYKIIHAFGNHQFDDDSNDSTDKVFSRSEERRVGKECRSRWSP